MKNRRLFLIFFAGILSNAFLPDARAASSYTLPMTLDYGMMDTLVLANYYNEPEGKTVVVNKNNGCTTIILSEPKFSQSDGVLTFETRVNVKLGKTIFKKCMPLARWDGYLVLYQEPVLDQNDWSLSFGVTDSKLMTVERKPAKVAGMVWNIVKDNVYSYLAGIKIDLSPPVKHLKEFLVPLFAQLQADEALSLVQSIRPGRVSVLPDALKLANTMDIPPEWITEPGETAEKELTDQEIDDFISVWEKWDTFLIKIILSLLNQPLLDEERQILLDTVLETRYGFLEELSLPMKGQDFVRRQFIAAWQQIHPIFRRHLADEKDKSLLSYLAFFTASDALISLDAVGPSLGIEITNDGFTRLVRMLLSEEFPVLATPEKQNPQLRELLGLQPWISRPTVLREHGIIAAITSFMKNLSTVAGPISLAHASENDTPDGINPEDMSQWVFRRSEFDAYVENMVQFLSPIGQSTLQESKLPERYHTLFQRMVLATAWQESCFRHYVRKTAEGITYLRSYNNSSVGIMQINERVWKGIYDIDSLRWDIEYNAKAGCEILDIYFNRYALRYLKKMTDTPDLDDEQFAGVIYAMYNGGPREFYKFLTRNNNHTLYRSDELFKQKYQWVDQEDLQKLAECLL